MQSIKFKMSVTRLYTLIIGLSMLSCFISPVYATGAASIDQQSLQTLTQNLRTRYVVGQDIPRFSLKQRMADYGVPGVAIGIIKNGKLVEAKGYGLIQTGKAQKVNADTF
jgi:CubicO group peptidase (beta-lactamase class C family)